MRKFFLVYPLVILSPFFLELHKHMHTKTILFSLLTVLVVTAKTGNGQNTEKTYHRFIRISKQVTFNLVERYYLFKKQ